jgi:hypothetical protein
LWLLLTGGHCSEVHLSYKNCKRELIMTVSVGWWSFAQV